MHGLPFFRKTAFEEWWKILITETWRRLVVVYSRIMNVS